MGYNAALLRTPPPLEDTGIRETPKPVRARIAELERQNGSLLGQKQSLERKHQADIAKLQSEIAALTGTTSTSSLAAQRTQAEAAAAQHKYEATISLLSKQLLQSQEQAKKGKEFGEGMLRERLRMLEDEKIAMTNDFDLRLRLSEHRTTLQTSKLETYIVDLEYKALKAEQEQLHVEHKHALAQAKTADLEEELAEALEMADRIESLQTDLETMTAKYESAAEALLELKDSRSSLDSESQALITELRASLKLANGEITTLGRTIAADKKQIAKLERTVAGKTEEVEELQREKEELSSGEKNKGGESDKQLKAMKIEIKDLKGELEGKDEDLKEAEANLEKVKKEAKEKEKAAKRGGKEEVEGLKTKISDLEDEIENLTKNNSALVTKARAYRDEAKAARATGSKVAESAEKKETVKRPAAVAEEEAEEEEEVQPVKKAKRDPPVAKKPVKAKSKVVSDDDEDEDDYVVDKPEKEIRRGRGGPKPSYVEESMSEIMQEKPAVPAGSTKSTAAPSTVQPVVIIKRPTPKIRAMSSKMQATIMEEDEDEEVEEVEEVEQEVVKRKSRDAPVAADAEKKKKRKLGGGLPIAPAFDFNGLIGGAANNSGMIPSTLSPMKNSVSILPRNSMSTSRSFGSNISSSRKMFGSGRS